MSTEVGRLAEQAVLRYLRRQGYDILAQNWRTRWCEIDLIARKGAVVYFVEVKYRRTAAYGSGLEYVTPKKLAQMHFAAEFWLAKHPQVGGDYRLSAAEVTGQDYRVTAWLDDV